MIRSFDLAYGFPPLILFLFLTGGSAAAQGEPENAPQPESAQVLAEDAVYGGDERVVETLVQKGGKLGYSLLGVNGYGGRASEYGYLHSSQSGGLFYRALEKELSFEAEGEFVNEHDYHGDLLADYLGDYRLHVRTESLFHNLDRELLFSPSFNATRADPPPPGQNNQATYLPIQDPSANYGVSVTQDLAEFRYRLHDFPLHVNLGYWRLMRQGSEQQIFADTAFEGAVNTIFAQARGVEQLTQEGHFGLDAHLGWLDLIYDFRIRVFQDRLPIPTQTYAPRSDLQGNPQDLGGAQQHNENPDSSFISHTVKAHTSLAGGVVGSASYSVDQRENLSRLTDTSGVKSEAVLLQNAAGDLVYTPGTEITLALKYRRQELDNENRGPVANVNYVTAAQVVQPPVDSRKEIVLATLSYKPSKVLTLAGEYRGEVLTRDHVSELPSLSSWALPKDSTTQKGSLTLLYHPAKGVRATARYDYESCDHPSYGNSFAQKQQGEFRATYTAATWGTTANLTVRREWNDQVEQYLANAPLTDPVSYTASSPLSRNRGTQNGNLGVWYTPFPKVTLAANFAYLHSRVGQEVLFTGVGSGSEAPATFDTRSQVLGANVTLAASEKLDLSLMLQGIRSTSAFAPQQIVFSAVPGDTSGIEELTRQDTVIATASARGEYRFTKLCSGCLEYSWQQYDERNTLLSAYNGQVHAVVAYLTAKW